MRKLKRCQKEPKDALLSQWAWMISKTRSSERSKKSCWDLKRNWNKNQCNSNLKQNRYGCLVLVQTWILRSLRNKKVSKYFNTVLVKFKIGKWRSLRLFLNMSNRQWHLLLQQWVKRSMDWDTQYLEKMPIKSTKLKQYQQCMWWIKSLSSFMMVAKSRARYIQQLSQFHHRNHLWDTSGSLSMELLKLALTQHILKSLNKLSITNLQRKF